VFLITEPQHQLALDVPAIFSLVICGLAAILGAAVALIYHLSHLEDIHRAMRRYSGMRAAQRQKAGRE
jgi:hypothetical protein